jgi:putative transposase
MGGSSVTKQRFLFKGIVGYRRYMKFIYDLTDMERYPEVRERLRALTFWEEYGLKATLDAFEMSRATLFRWKEVFLKSRKSPSSLINRSKKPHNTRRMYLDERIYLFLKSIREKYPRLGKDKIKVLLDEYCHEERLEKEILSASKIGRIIKKNNWYFYLGKRKKGTIRIEKKRVFGYQVNDIGDLVQMDTIVRFEHGVKRYIFSAIDVSSRFAFAYAYKNRSSTSVSDFIQKLDKVSPFTIKAVQTDNGSEFVGKADTTLKDMGIVHLFSYPNSPKQNAFVERLNRTLQEDVVEEYREFLELDLDQFNDKLIDYLLFYNTKRPHYSLGNKVPLKLISDKINHANFNQQESNMYWTHTPC